ncbi:hypothetical protein EG68_04110 [Paragonimus skrjabini miyazakii]|uniref:Uncharacterized protein n=1 Tax=Paragonimus skrjabini miyazakii TaxID=59628 RepID=A0A8S9YUK0_9TREM|nr:hypothetical protein EG68_04110 [Paragonimus skrjabini miyazakii]
MKTKKNPTKKKGRESSNSPEARGDSDVLVRMLLMQQFQQQSSMWQMALMQMLNRQNQPMNRWHDRLPPPPFYVPESRFELPPLLEPKAEKPKRLREPVHTFPGPNNAKKLRIFGYIGLFTMLVKKVGSEPPFIIEKSAGFALILSTMVLQARDYILRPESELDEKLRTMGRKEKYDLVTLESRSTNPRQLAPLVAEARDLMSCAVRSIVVAITIIQPTAKNVVTKPSEVQVKLLICGVFVLRALVTEVSQVVTYSPSTAKCLSYNKS